jgi:hypothetical protein
MNSPNGKTALIKQMKLVQEISQLTQKAFATAFSE